MTCFCLDTHLCFITQGKNPSDLLKTRMLKITRQICQGSRWWGTWRPSTWHDLLPSLLNTKSYGKTRQEQAPHACQITSTSQLNATLHHAPLDFFSEWRASSPILFPFPSLCQQSHTAMYNTSVGGCQTVQTNRLVVVVVLLPWFTWSKCLTKVEQISLAGGCEQCAKTPMLIHTFVHLTHVDRAIGLPWQLLDHRLFLRRPHGHDSLLQASHLQWSSHLGSKPKSNSTHLTKLMFTHVMFSHQMGYTMFWPFWAPHLTPASTPQQCLPNKPTTATPQVETIPFKHSPSPCAKQCEQLVGQFGILPEQLRTTVISVWFWHLPQITTWLGCQVAMPGKKMGPVTMTRWLVRIGTHSHITSSQHLGHCVPFPTSFDEHRAHLTSHMWMVCHS